MIKQCGVDKFIETERIEVDGLGESELEELLIKVYYEFQFHDKNMNILNTTELYCWGPLCVGLETITLRERP